MASKTIEIKWDNDEHTIIRETYIGNWTWDDFYDSVGVVPPMMISVSHTVHILIDLRESGPVPIGSAIVHARSAMQRFPQNWGIMAVVGPSMFIRSLVDIIRSILPGRLAGKIFVARSFEEAYALMEQYGPAQTAS